MRKTLAEIAKLVEGEVVGDSKIVITGLAGLREAKEGDLSFLANSKYSSLIDKTQASAILVPRKFAAETKTIIRTDNPSLAFAKIALTVIEGTISPKPQGIHKTAVIAKDAKVGKGVAVGAYAVVERKAAIGDNTVIFSGCFIGPSTTIGRDCLIYPNTTIRERVTIGRRVIIHSGAVIGSDGFGFEGVEGGYEKIPQIGTVIIEDDVEIGANATIDRARFDKTIIQRGTKIDNLVQIAHNVSVGENCIIVSQAGISGSVKIEKNVILAGQAGVAGHLTIGEGAIVAAQAGVTKSVPAHTTVSGYPAKEHEKAKRVNACLQRLPEYVKTVNELKKKIELLEAKLENRTHGIDKK